MSACDPKRTSYLVVFAQIEPVRGPPHIFPQLVLDLGYTAQSHVSLGRPPERGIPMSETVLIVSSSTAVLALLFGARVAMRAMAPRTNAAAGSGPPDVPGVIVLPP